MTNTEIMHDYRTAHNIPEETALYTASVWYNMGYAIRRGTKCEHRVTLKARSKNGFYSKSYAMFTADQVEKRN